MIFRSLPYYYQILIIMNNIRIGHGYDVHAFETGDHLILGGLSIPYSQQFKAHSDGDVLLHAICDALLGALALGDIGQHFPDNDPNYSGVDSRVLLREVYQLINQHGWLLSNIDCLIIAQEPKLMPYLPSMREIVAEDLSTSIDNISIKATTTEKLGFEGRKEGIAAHATLLLYKPSE